MKVSSRGLAVTGSPTLAINAKAKALKAEGLDVVGFGAGEPDFDTPEFVRDAAKEALDQGMTRYTPAGGSADLQKAVCEKLWRDNGLRYAPSQIVISNGAKQSLFNTFMALCNPGEEVLIPCPYWVSYPEIVKMAGGIPVPVMGSPENDFKPTAEEIESKVTDKTRAIILTSPNNPNGYVFTREELTAIGNLAVKHDFYIVADEIYEFLIYDGLEHVSIASICPEFYDRTVTINGVSKAYAMTGWRIGYTACPENVAKAMVNYQSHSTSGPNTIAQYAAMKALQGPTEDREKMVAEFARRKNRIVELINAIPGISCVEPKGAFYVMMKVSGLFGRKTTDGDVITDDMSFAKLLLSRNLVAVVPGTGFAAPEYVRLSYAISMETIEKGITRIGDFVRDLQ